MKRTTTYILAGVLLAVLLVGLASFWEGSIHASKTSSIQRVTVGQLADAMQQDHFYTTYGNAALLFRGRVSDTKLHGNTSLVTFTTGRPYDVVCQFPKSVSYRMGQTISVIATGGSAVRQASGVLLRSCVEN